MKTLFTFILLVLCLKVSAQTSLTVAINQAGEIIPSKISGKKPVTLNVGDSVILLSYSPKPQAWYSQFNDLTGTIADSLINQSPDYSAFKKTFIDRDHKSEMIKKYGALRGSEIANGTVKIGMTKAMIEDALGKPDAVNRILGGGSMQEQWSYERLPNGKPGTYIFANGKLVRLKN